MACPIDWLPYGTAIQLSCLTLLAIPATKGLLHHGHSISQTNDKEWKPYRDEDGEATKESEAACSDEKPRSIMNIAAATGLAAVLYSIQASSSANMASVYTWVCNFRTRSELVADCTGTACDASNCHLP